MAAFIGAGIVSVAPWDGLTAFDSLTFVDVGNVSALNISVTESRQELRNYRTAAGGTYASVARVKSASLQMDFRDFSSANLELALWAMPPPRPASPRSKRSSTPRRSSPSSSSASTWSTART